MGSLELGVRTTRYGRGELLGFDVGSGAEVMDCTGEEDVEDLEGKSDETALERNR